MNTAKLNFQLKKPRLIFNYRQFKLIIDEVTTKPLRQTCPVNLKKQ